ncbi:TPA: hypothetical protein JAJ60_002775, partial [Corynebacterium striatum]|nr:hypothetical protein [Corynebacterium striatum]HAT6401297.1 hypothetical protein [Corynebacterium striatum]HAT6409553.1 hypothetical protein [Corynebacterium striatum]HAT6414838.1 hypothetical protein [Corynebacterium striatum]HAT6417489.1 hypothetical protein [Corynebacterium striatum]
PVAERVTDDIEVAGRAGTLTRLGGWHDTSITLPLAITGGLAAYHKAALALTRAATIHLSHQPGAFHKVKHASISPLRMDMSAWGFFEAHLVCEPFSYLDSGLTAHTLTASGQITNPGLVEAAPLITIKGTGALTLTINGTAYRVQSPAGQITLDSARLVAHVAGRVQTDAVTGTFPILTPGVNRV